MQLAMESPSFMHRGCSILLPTPQLCGGIIDKKIVYISSVWICAYMVKWLPGMSTSKKKKVLCSPSVLFPKQNFERNQHEAELRRRPIFTIPSWSSSLFTPNPTLPATPLAIWASSILCCACAPPLIHQFS